jgi:hypothetical protein
VTQVARNFAADLGDTGQCVRFEWCPMMGLSPRALAEAARCPTHLHVAPATRKRLGNPAGIGWSQLVVHSGGLEATIGTFDGLVSGEHDADRGRHYAAGAPLVPADRRRQSRLRPALGKATVPVLANERYLLAVELRSRTVDSASCRWCCSAE